MSGKKQGRFFTFLIVYIARHAIHPVLSANLTRQHHKVGPVHLDAALGELRHHPDQGVDGGLQPGVRPVVHVDTPVTGSAHAVMKSYIEGWGGNMTGL